MLALRPFRLFFLVAIAWVCMSSMFPCDLEAAVILRLRQAEEAKREDAVDEKEGQSRI